MFPELPSLDQCLPDRVASALDEPWQTFDGEELYPGLALKAAVILYGFAKGHPCPKDGNKRIGTILMGTFLLLNEARLDASPDDLEGFVLGIATSSPPKRAEVLAASASWIEDRISVQGKSWGDS